MARMRRYIGRGQIKQAQASWACALGRDPGENRGRLLLREREGFGRGSWPELRGATGKAEPTGGPGLSATWRACCAGRGLSGVRASRPKRERAVGRGRKEGKGWAASVDGLEREREGVGPNGSAGPICWVGSLRFSFLLPFLFYF